MKGTFKELIKSTLISICTATLIFCAVGVVFDVKYGGNFALDNYRFTKMVLGCVGVGIGFGVPSIIYKNEFLPMPIRTLIHLGIGGAVYLVIAHSVGWIGNDTSLSQGLLIAAIQIIIVLLIWFAFFSHYKKEAALMNKKINDMKNE